MTRPTKDQLIQDTLKGLDEIGEYSRVMREFILMRLGWAYELGYYHGWKNEFDMNRTEADEDNEPSKTVNA